MYKLDPSVKIQWSISLFIRTLFFSGLFLVADLLFIRKLFPDFFLPMGVLPGIVFLLGLILTFLLPPLQYKYWSFEIREDELFLVRGILTRVKTTAPFKRIQHLDVVQSITDRMLDLGKLVIYTAGTRGADLIIPGLPIEYAEDLRDTLKNVTVEDAV